MAKSCMTCSFYEDHMCLRRHVKIAAPSSWVCREYTENGCRKCAYWSSLRDECRRGLVGDIGCPLFARAA